MGRHRLTPRILQAGSTPGPVRGVLNEVRFEDRFEVADRFAQYENGLRKGSDGHRQKTKDAFARLETLNSGSTLPALTTAELH